MVDNRLSCAPPTLQRYFYRTSGGTEVDLLLAWPGGEIWAIEVRRLLSPKVERGFHAACGDLSPARKLAVYPGSESFPLGNDVHAVSLHALCRELAAKAR